MKGLSEKAEFELGLQRLVMRYSLSWLATGCLIGFLMASLLLHPELGKYLGEFTYGRWVPVHLNFVLFGWCALPMVGVLLKSYLRPGPAALKQANFALGAWSLALIMGGISWLAGETSGKLFLDWAGIPRLLFMAALWILWVVLGWNYAGNFLGLMSAQKDRAQMVLKGVILAGLAFVPWALYHQTQQNAYPAIDPGTGGPTGSSLLISTLGILLVFALIPRLLGIGRKPGLPSAAAFWSWFGIATLYFLAIDHGNSSHWEGRQIAGVALLLAGAPTVILYLRDFQWRQPSLPWLTAVVCWWAALVVVGFVIFLPGVLEHVKFTHSLIAHADLAMPGLVTSLNMLILCNLAGEYPSPTGKDRVSNRLPVTGKQAFWLWQGALIFQVVLLFAIGAMEWADTGELWKVTGYAAQFFSLRLLTGISMGIAALSWAWTAWIGEDYEPAG